MKSLRILTSKGETPLSLLKQGIEHITQQRHEEGIALLVLAREQFALGQAFYLPFLDEIIQIYTNYNQAQKRLMEASREFTSTEKALQVSLNKLEQALTTALPEIHTVVQLHDSQCYPSIVSSSSSPPTFQALSPCLHTIAKSDALPELSITFFGRFEVRRGQQLLTLCQNRSGQAILRYLLAQSGYRATADKLMEVYWPNDDPEVARRKLQVAVSALRRSLNGEYAYDRGGGYILCKHMTYAINPEIVLTTDVDNFLSLYETGKHMRAAEMFINYTQACQLYTGPFLVEDTYAD